MPKRIFSKIVKEESVGLSEAGAILACSRWTLYRKIKDGSLKVFRVDGKGPYKVRLSELEKLKKAIVRENVTFSKQMPTNANKCQQNFKAKIQGTEKH